MNIKNLPVRLPEIGRVRFGERIKGSDGKVRPTKGEFLRFTSNDALTLNAIASQHGGEVFAWPDGEQHWQLTSETDSIPIYLPPNPLDTSYERWGSGGIARRCDGERCVVPITDAEGGHMEEDDCICIANGWTPGDRDDVKNNGACQLTVRGRVVIPDVPGIGIWLFTSHSDKASKELTAQVRLVEAMAERGMRIRAVLAIEQRNEKMPWEKYRREFIVPVLRFPDPIKDLERGIAAPTYVHTERELRTYPDIGVGTPALDEYPKIPELPAPDSAREPSEGVALDDSRLPPAVQGGNSEPPALTQPSPDGSAWSAPTSSTPVRSPFVNPILRQIEHKGLDRALVASLLEEHTKVESVEAIADPDEANALMAAIRAIEVAS